LSSRCCPRAGARYLSTRTGVLSQGVPAVADDIDPRKVESMARNFFFCSRFSQPPHNVPPLRLAVHRPSLFHIVCGSTTPVFRHPIQ
jgi:hypothetical protein